MSQLPAGWALATIHDLVQFNPKSEASDNAICGFVPMAGLGTKYGAQLKVHEERPWSEVKRAYTHFKNGDVLIAKVTPCFENGKAGIANDLPSGLGAGSSEFCVFRPSSGLDGRYLLGWFSSEDFRRRATLAMTGSVGLKRVPKDVFLGEQVPLAPAGEQQRIADKLDSLLARVDDVSARLARVAPLLKRFRQSVLAAAISGRLTEDWRRNFSSDLASSPAGLWDIPVTWHWARADFVSDFITKGTTPSKDQMFSGVGEVPFLKVYNLGFDGKLDFTVDPTFVSEVTHKGDLKRSLVVPGDVLMNIVGPPLGKVALVPDDFPEWNINQAIARFRPIRDLSSQYLAFCLMNTGLIAHAVGQAKATAGQFNLTLEICRALPIPVPSSEEQTEIVRRVDLLFAFADRLEARLSAAHTATQRLTPALLAKAFRGELVPQDPNDEPASELLARIGLATTAASKLGKKLPIGSKQAARKTVIA
jgi:type I restriction enzyme S subunit